MGRDFWNRCADCGKAIPYDDFESGHAVRNLLTPSAHGFDETWETLCAKHKEPINAD
jgi:hypothetical protein